MRIDWLAFSPLLCVLASGCGNDSSSSVEQDASATPEPDPIDAASASDGGRDESSTSTPTEDGRDGSVAEDDVREDDGDTQSAEGGAGSSEDDPATDAGVTDDEQPQDTNPSPDGGSSDSSEPNVPDAAAEEPPAPNDPDGGEVEAADVLGASTFVFERKVADGNDHIIAMDYLTGEQRVVTTLAEGSVAGWGVDGIAVSPDRSRLVIATLFGASAEDTATGLATNILWNLDVNGDDFLRLTPPFPNSRPDVSGWRIDVRDPAFSPDGQFIVFDYGEGDFDEGYVAPWVVSAAGEGLPGLLETELDCSVNGNGTFNPVTGDLLLAHVICLPDVDSGYYLYPNAGGTPDYIVNEQGASLSTEPPAFSHDGSVLVYTARTDSDGVQSLYAYILSERTVVPLVYGGDGVDIINASFAPDDAHLVYCVRQGDSVDLHLLDLTTDPATDVALTDDGVSCDPVF